MRKLQLLLVLFVLLPSLDARAAEFESTPNSIEKVRIFTGYTVSKNGALSTPSVVTIIETRAQLDCRFIAFVNFPLAFRDIVKIPAPGQKIVFRGVEQLGSDGEANDQRGFLVNWEAELVGHEIQGSFKQPFDEGRFYLREAYVEITGKD